MATKETLSKDTFGELIRDAGGWSEFLYAMYRKLIQLTERLDQGKSDTQMSTTVDTWVEEALAAAPPDEEGEDEQMLGDYSASYGWHLLHPACESWPEVRRLRANIVADCKAQSVFRSGPDLVVNAVEMAVRAGRAFQTYRDWVWSMTGDPDTKPAVAGLDPWSYLPGLQELAGEADDPAWRCRFIEIHQGSR